MFQSQLKQNDARVIVVSSNDILGRWSNLINPPCCQTLDLLHLSHSKPRLSYLQSKPLTELGLAQPQLIPSKIEKRINVQG